MPNVNETACITEYMQQYEVHTSNVFVSDFVTYRSKVTARIIISGPSNLGGIMTQIGYHSLDVIAVVKGGHGQSQVAMVKSAVGVARYEGGTRFLITASAANSKLWRMVCQTRAKLKNRRKKVKTENQVSRFSRWCGGTLVVVPYMYGTINDGRHRLNPIDSLTLMF